jgi:hypothetical protein
MDLRLLESIVLVAHEFSDSCNYPITNKLTNYVKVVIYCNSVAYTPEWYIWGKHKVDPTMPTCAASCLTWTPHRGCYYSRMKAPLDLQQGIGKKELGESLRTGYTTEAHFKARVIAEMVRGRK